jgi:HK97 gp10 family phage protein
MIELRIEGVSDVAEAMKKLSSKLRGDIGTRAVVAALTPIINAAKTRAESSRDTGALIDSIGMRIKRKTMGRGVFGVVGPRRGFRRPDGRDPVKYAHLVEFGHYTAAKSGVTPAALSRGTKGKSLRRGTLYAQAYVLAKPFLRPAWQEVKSSLPKIVAEEIGNGIANEVKKRTKRRNAKSKK